MIPEFDWPVRLGAAAAALGLVAVLILRARHKDRREYRRFRRYRSTVRRQAMFRRWLIESALLFGSAAVVLLALTWPLVTPLLERTQALPWIAVARDALGTGLGIGLSIGAVLVLAALTAVGMRSARAEGGIIVVGDIGALLPRNRPELGWGAALSINAGVVEEALFRLALPALLVVITAEPLSAFGLAVLLFGALHAYQGPVGMIGATVNGLLLSAVYVLSGSILLTMLVHVVFDLRTLVLIPAVVYRVHRVPGSIRMPPLLPLDRPAVTEPAPTEAPTATPPQPQPGAAPPGAVQPGAAADSEA